MLSSQIIEIKKAKKPLFDKSGGFFLNGGNNAYPDEIEFLFENSVTAFTGFQLLHNYVSGDWQNGSNWINSDQSINDFNNDVAENIVKFGGVFVQFDYEMKEGKYTPTSPKVLPFTDCRLGKKDDDEYNGKILVSKNFDDKKKKPLEFDVFNPKVALIQKEKQGKNYKGQILYYTTQKKYYYPKSILHPVINDCESEIQASIFKNRSLTKGFFGKQLLFTRPFVDSQLPDDNELKITQKKERNDFKENLQKFMGAENVGNVLHIEMEFDSMADIDKQIIYKEISTNINDKLFEFTEKSTANNIRKALYNIPYLLLENSDNAMFGNSGEAIVQARKFYFESTDKIRTIHVDFMKYIFEIIGLQNQIYIPLQYATSNNTI